MKKLMNKKAFTLMEMLIVVAIIAVLVAIAIPTMSNSLTKAKEAADVANIRAAYAQIQVELLTDSTKKIPDDENALVDYITKMGSSLNYNGTTDKLTYTVSNGEGTIKYASTELEKTGSTAKTYTWTLKDIN